MGEQNGIVHTGTGDITVSHSRFGSGRDDGRRRPDGVDVGVLTVLPVETYAVAEMLGRAADFSVREAADGVHVHRATVSGVRVAALQTWAPGQRSAMAAVHQLVELAAPRVIALVGIAGSIDPHARLGDVVLAHEVFYYDSRKETPDGPEYRGQMLASAPVVGRKINQFLSRTAPPHPVRDRQAPERWFHLMQGPIGSGEAVIADADAAERRYLKRTNSKVLAVETEAGGVAQAVFEQLGDRRRTAGWLTVRGVSDTADATKDEAHQLLAARHAAQVTELLLPFLRLPAEPR